MGFGVEAAEASSSPTRATWPERWWSRRPVPERGSRECWPWGRRAAGNFSGYLELQAAPLSAPARPLVSCGEQPGKGASELGHTPLPARADGGVLELSDTHGALGLCRPGVGVAPALRGALGTRTHCSASASRSPGRWDPSFRAGPPATLEAAGVGGASTRVGLCDQGGSDPAAPFPS